MLVNFFGSGDLRKDFDLSFSFRYSQLYATGLARRLKMSVPLYPVYFLDLSHSSPFAKYIPMFVRRGTLAITRLALFGPLLIYEGFVLFRLFKRLSPDVLHINNGGYPASLSARAAAIAGHFAGVRAIVMVVNNMAADYGHYARWIDYPVDRVVVRTVDVFVTGSIAASSRLQTVLGLPDSKLIRIHNGVLPRSPTESVFSTRERLGLGGFDGVVFGVVALLIPRKGHQVLLEAVLKLVTEEAVSSHGEFVVLIEGDGPLAQELAAFVLRNDLSGFVKFVGDEMNVVDFMTALDVLILPSVEDEDFPNVVIEAMALGKPVIASRLAGTAEQVDHGVTGWLVEPRRADQLAGAMIDLMGDSQVRTRMGGAAMNRFNDKFTNGKAVASYMNVYKELIGLDQR